jgi:hypothetical protein
MSTETTTRKPYLTRRVFDGLVSLAERASAQTRDELDAIAWISAMAEWRRVQSITAPGAGCAVLSPERSGGAGNRSAGREDLDLDELSPVL